MTASTRTGLPTRTRDMSALVAILISLSVVLLVSLGSTATAQQLLIHTSYYCLMVTVLCWAATYLHAARGLRRDTIFSWLKDNWPGLVVAFSVTWVAALAIEPALRVLSDEATLVGISKNFYADKSATFTVSGKYYYGRFWDVDVVIDQRPTLFPFLVSLLHAIFGYSYTNAFHFNLLLLPAFLLVSYRLAKSLGGESFALVASLFVVAHPITLITVRSGAFDFLAAFFALLVLKSLLDFARDEQPVRLATLWMNLCMFSGIRYESALFIPLVIGLLLLFKMLSWRIIRPYAFIYALTPVYFLPRIWLSLLRGNVPAQDPGTDTFSIDNFFKNLHEYFEPILSPQHSYPAHSALLIGCGLIGLLFWVSWLVGRVRTRDLKAPELKFAVFVAGWMIVQLLIVFTYTWGRAQYPTSARLVLAIDTFFSFAAAWFLTRSLKRWSTSVPVLLALAVFLMQLPVAAEHRMMHRLTQSRENAATWRFFERLHEKRLLIVTDRPSHFTIMNYGAMNFEKARSDPFLFTALDRHLFQDIYLIQQIKISTNQPLPGYEFWSERGLDPVFELQNDANVLVRISRVLH